MVIVFFEQNDKRKGVLRISLLLLLLYDLCFAKKKRSLKNISCNYKVLEIISFYATKDSFYETV